MNITKHLPLGFLGAIAVTSAAVLAGGRVAEASNEFPPNPSVVITMACKPTLVGDLHVTYKNDGGLSDAEFTTVIDGVTQPHVSLDAAIWGEVHYPLGEGSAGVVTISAPGMTTVNATVGPVDCFAATMHTEVVCISGTPTMSVTATNTGKLDDSFGVELLNSPSPVVKAALAVGASYTWTVTLADGAEDVASLLSMHTGLVASQSGSASCVLPTTTVVETTAPAATTPPTVPETTVGPAPSTTAAVIVDPPATSSAAVGVPEPAQLPETGTSTTMMLLTAAGFVVTGWLLRRSTSV